MSPSELPKLWKKKIGKIWPILDTENDFETQNFDIFDKVVHDFGKPDEVTIYWKNAYFQ